MHSPLRCVVAALALLVTIPAFAADKVQPVRLGTGVMTFETVPGWGLRPDGKSALGSTHGAVVIDKAGAVYVSANKGVVVFAPEGSMIKEYVGKDFTSLHDMEIRAEGDEEFIYGARNGAAEGIKFNARTGEIVFKLPFPKESGLNLTKFSPTAITVAPNGEIFLSDGYASNHIFVFDKAGKYLRHFGEKGNELKQFNTAHGMTLDTRYEPPRLLVCDRNHTPKGRLLHYGLDGSFIGEVITGLGMPTSASVQGDYVSVPDLLGRLVILDKENKIVATLGENPDPEKGKSFGITQDKWVEGAFSGTHGSYWDKDGNLYVQDWNVDGRIMKLVRVKQPAATSGE
ncbi:MAG: 6-bladed beta-propeller [Planctomycetia bacterium]|nr:6-bladed beta-propeller [Planctomycetia bacterium]